MRDLGRDYVRAVNRTYLRTATMREERLKSSLLDSYRYCLTCYCYIELNPVRANMVRHPTSYPRSSFHFNAMSKPDPLVTAHDCWLLPGECDHTRSEATGHCLAKT
jgi:putative transposase